MRKKPPSWDQPTLFPLNPKDSAKPQNPVNSVTTGDDHAVQNHSSRTTQGTEGTPRAATPDPQAPADDGDLRSRTESPPRALEGDAGNGDPGKRSQPDLFGSNGNGALRTGGSFALRASPGRWGAAFARPGDGLPPKSFVEKVRPARGQRSLF